MNTEALINDWLLQAASKGAIVLGLALLAGLVLCRAAAAKRYAVWMAAMVTLAVLPMAIGLLPAWHVLPLPQNLPPVVATSAEESGESPVKMLSQTPAVPAPVHVAMAAPAAEAPAVPAPADHLVIAHSSFWQQRLLQWWPVLWLAGAASLVLRVAWSAWRLRRLEKTLPEGCCDLLGKVARELGLRRAPRVLVGNSGAVPMVWGLWRPRLLLPQGFDLWPAEKLRSVLLHELAHLQRRDPLALWLSQCVKALHWFNPLAWLAFRQLRADQERACDDTVLRHGVRPSDYAQHLLDLSRQARMAPGLALCALTITRCAPVESRVKAVLDAKRPRQALTRPWFILMAVLSVFTALPLAMLHALEGDPVRGRIVDRNGVVLAESTKDKARHYPLKHLTSHVLGYVGMPAPEARALHGRTGLEQKEDTLLAAGKEVVLSLDGRVQSLTARAMQEAGCNRGAAVVLDPRTGEILAAVSLPSYNAGEFVPTLPRATWELLSQDPDAPLLDRCFQGTYTPGAAFMPLTALAGISAGAGDAHFECQGSVTYGSQVFQCWKSRADGGGHGSLGMTDALVHSCSCYWYQFGNKTGVEAIAKTARLLGFDAAYGVTAGESAGVLPTPQWLASHRSSERWSLGYTANLAIGQGALAVSPLHMAVLAATVAQRGKVPQPTFMKIKAGEEVKIRADLLAEGAKAEQMDLLREGMRQVVNQDGGTGKAARSDKVVIAGKTGTAQAWRRVGGERVDDNTTWFIGFAPYDKPSLAFAILKQGGKSGGSDCAPIARHIVEGVLALPADGSGDVRLLEAPAGGAKRRTETHSERMKRLNDRREEVEAKAKAARQRLEDLEARVNMLKQALPKNQEALDAVFDELRTLFELRHPPPSSAKFVEKEAMGAVEMERWQMLQNQAALAELPAKVRVQLLTKEENLMGAAVKFLFRFTGTRQDVRAWLLASLSAKRQKDSERMLSWPDAPQPFERFYSLGDGAFITLYTLDGMSLDVVVSKYRRVPLIAPNEATPPRPKSAAPKELQGVVEAEGARPELDTQSYTLPPALAVENEMRFPAFDDDLPAHGPLNPFQPPAAVLFWVNDPVPLNLQLVEEQRFKDELTAAMEQHRAKNIDVTLLTNTLPPAK